MRRENRLHLRHLGRRQPARELDRLGLVLRVRGNGELPAADAGRARTALVMRQHRHADLALDLAVGVVLEPIPDVAPRHRENQIARLHVDANPVGRNLGNVLRQHAGLLHPSIQLERLARSGRVEIEFLALRDFRAGTPQRNEIRADGPFDRSAGRREALQLRTLLAVHDDARRLHHFVPGLGHRSLVFLEQVLAIVEKLRVGEIRQRDQFAVDLIGIGVRFQILREDFRLVGAEIRIERLGPALRRPLRGTDHVDQDHVEHRILRREHRRQILLLCFGGRAADFDVHLHVRILLLILVGDLAHHVRSLLSAGEDAQRGLLGPRVRCEHRAKRDRRDHSPRLHRRLLAFFVSYSPAPRIAAPVSGSNK